MRAESFILPLTVNGKKVKATGTKFKPMREKLYRISVPLRNGKQCLYFTMKDAATHTFPCYKHNNEKADMLAEEIMRKLQKSKI